MVTGAFSGAKIAILSGHKLVTLLRDARPGLPWADFWDIPGGAREAGETPLETALRETREEVGLVVDRARIVWRSGFERPHGRVHSFVALWPGLADADLTLGDEGQACRLMDIGLFLSRPDAIPMLQDGLAAYLGTADDPARAIRVT